jgi:hypothetical protein
MVPSSLTPITTDGERLTCSGFSLSETVRLRNFELIVDYFGSLSLSPRTGDASVTFMGSTHSGGSTLRLAMIGELRPPLSQKVWHGASLVPMTTTP